jgi:hypothetical protein
MLAVWLPSQPWFGDVEASTINAVGTYRFDDPRGEVGIETHLLGVADGRTIQVPVTYRGMPLKGAESFLIGTSYHSVLGERWVYDACGDVTYLTALANTILQGGHEAELEVMTQEGLVRRETTTRVMGSGSRNIDVRILEPLVYKNVGPLARITAANIELVISRVIKDDFGNGADYALSGSWPGQRAPVRLAFVLFE